MLVYVFTASQLLAEPTLNAIQKIDFGELLGMFGTCHLAYDTKILTDQGGGLCPFADVRYGEPGKYLIIATPNSTVRIRIEDRPNSGDGITFTPEGVYQVFEQPDVPIVVKSSQDIYSGDTGVITILMGGTLTTTIDQDFNKTFNISIINGITFDELP